MQTYQELEAVSPLFAKLQSCELQIASLQQWRAVLLPTAALCSFYQLCSSRVHQQHTGGHCCFSSAKDNQISYFTTLFISKAFFKLSEKRNILKNGTCNHNNTYQNIWRELGHRHRLHLPVFSGE